jgi:hypothetical protein
MAKDNPTQVAAKEILLRDGWDELAIRQALHPRMRAGRVVSEGGRSFIPIAQVNPEQFAAITWLFRVGWDVHKIAEAVPVPEAEVARLLTTRKHLDDWVSENF